MDGPHLPGGLIIYQGNPSTCPRTHICPVCSSIFSGLGAFSKSSASQSSDLAQEEETVHSLRVGLRLGDQLSFAARDAELCFACNRR